MLNERGMGKMAYTRAQFIKKVGPMAQADSMKSQILASLTIAQAILESNNGNSRLTTEANALFGIKVSTGWRGKVWTGSTTEYMNGGRQTLIAGFRAYDSWEESIHDHATFLLGNKRYQKVIGEKDYKKACLAIQKAGYATDPLYAEKLISLIEQEKLYQYDGILQQEDKQLAEVVSKIILSGIKLDYNSWKRMELMKLVYVPQLLVKLGGIDRLVQQGIVNQREIWDKGDYNSHHVRSLLIKFASKLS